jgi:hypothetical protein
MEIPLAAGAWVVRIKLGSSLLRDRALFSDFLLLLFLICAIVFSNMRLTIVSIVGMLFGAAQASLYGESNLNHTCQLRRSSFSSLNFLF